MSDLREQAMRALGSNSVQQAVAKVHAVIGPKDIPDSEAAAQSALHKLHRGETPTSEELTALEHRPIDRLRSMGKDARQNRML